LMASLRGFAYMSIGQRRCDGVCLRLCEMALTITRPFFFPLMLVIEMTHQST
jgi:hypothetical protein